MPFTEKTLDMLNVCEESDFNRTNMETVKQFIAYCEKKKCFYNINVVAQCTEKKKKKNSSKNKYILFNSWFNKIRKNRKINGYGVWNHMKESAVAKPFTDIFEYMENLNKSIKSKPVAVADDETDHKQRESANNQQVQEMRKKYTDEFYRVLTETYNIGTPPSTSFIYEQKLAVADYQLEKLTRQSVLNAVETFRIVLNTVLAKDENKNENDETAPVVKQQRKRKPAAPKKPPAAKRAMPPPPLVHNMIDDDENDESQMSD